MSPNADLIFQQAKEYLTPAQKALIEDIQTIFKQLQNNHINDYSFLVAPAAKAYEGFLKDFFFKIGIIDRFNYKSDRFRVGKTLNPSLRYKRFSIYQKLATAHDNGEELAEVLWDAWKYGRNLIFHYFPDQLDFIKREEADRRILLILNAIIKAGLFMEENKLSTHDAIMETP